MPAAFRFFLTLSLIALIHCKSAQNKTEETGKISTKVPNPPSEFDRSKYAIQTGDEVSLTPSGEDFTSEKIDYRDEEKTDEKNGEEGKESPDSAKKEPVHYSGRRLIREVKYHERVKKKSIVLSIDGRARVRHGETLLSSSKIEILGENGDIIYINRYLTITDGAYATKLTAGLGEYIKSEKTAYITKSPVAVHTNEKDSTQTTLKAVEMYRDFTTGMIHAKGNVEIINSDGITGYGKEAFYYEKEDLVILLGNPTIYEKENIYKADVMKFYNGEKLVVLQGNATVYLTREEKNNKEETGEIQTIIRAPNGTYRFGKSAPMGREVIFLGEEEDPVKIFRPDMEGSCRTLKVLGENSDEIKADGNVYVLDLKDRTRLYTQSADFQRRLDTLVITTHYNRDELRTPPRIVFHNKNDVPTGLLTAEKITYEDRKNVITAEGGVVFESLEEKTEPEERTTLNGQWARYEGQLKKIEIRGDPYLARGDSRVYAHKIIIFTDEKNVQIFGPVFGKIINKNDEEEGASPAQ